VWCGFVDPRDDSDDLSSVSPSSDIIMMEDLPGLAPGPAPSPAPSPTVAPDPVPDAYRPVGLTKAVLSLHTQKEEQAFLSRFRDLGRLRGLHSSTVAPSTPGERGSHLGLPRAAFCLV
jgi:period circadian protein